MSLYNRARELYGNRTAKKLSEFFNDMQLPMPLEDEFTETEDKGFLVFLNDPGVVIRLSRRSYGLWNDSRRVIHPLGSRNVGRLRADINPGINCPITEEQRTELTAELRKEKRDFVDPGLYNGGTLPALTNKIKAGYAVAIDPVAVCDLSSAVSLVKKWLCRKLNMKCGANQESADDPQAILYGRLKDAFKAAWKTGDARPDATGIKQFWQIATQMKATKLLVASWLTPEMKDRNYKNAYYGSLRYAQHRELKPLMEN